MADHTRHRAARREPRHSEDLARSKIKPPMLERMLRALVILVTLALVAASGAYGYVRYRFDQINKVSISQLQQVEGGQPFDILLVGSDSREGETTAQQASRFGTVGQYSGQRSDVIKILRIDPINGTAKILDIPRDLMVQLDGVSNRLGHLNRVNAAFNNGPGPLIQTIEDNLGIPIAHYVEIDFFGFEGAVNAVGGVWINFPAPARDTLSGLNVTHAGCQLLNGDQALALARSRHYEYELRTGYWVGDGSSDFGRIKRQDSFLKALVEAGNSKIDPLSLNAFLGSVVHDITIDSSFSLGDLLTLAQRYHGFSPSELQSQTIPTYSVGYWGSVGDVLFIKEPDAQQMLQSFAGLSLQRPTTPPPAPSGLPVVVPGPQIGSTGPLPAPTNVPSTTSTTQAPLSWFDPTPCRPSG